MKAINQQTSNGWTETILENDHGMCLKFLNFGGIVTDLIVPDKRGVHENVVLSYADLSHYKENKPYFGALIGPVAGRIKDACFIKKRKKNIRYQQMMVIIICMVEGMACINSCLA